MAVITQWSNLGTTQLLERHYDSQKDLAEYLMQSQVYNLQTRTILWRDTLGTDPGELLGSYQLTRACDRLLGIVDSDCQASMDTVTAITKRVTNKVQSLPALDVHRRRTQGRSGHTLNIHKVNRGQLSTAWKRTVREHSIGQTGVITLVLCTDYTSNATYEAAQYTIAATLALANKIEETGRRCEIWASILTHDAHRMRSSIVPGHPKMFDELDHLIVKRAQESLTAPGMAVMCSLDLVRKVFFQIWQQQRDTIGRIVNHGRATKKQQVRIRLEPYLLRQHIPTESVYMGADENDHIHSEGLAVSWVTRELRRIHDACLGVVAS